MDKFLTIGLMVCGGLLFLTQLLNYYIHIGRNKNQIKNKITSYSSSTKRLIAFTLIFGLALILLFVKEGGSLLLIGLAFVVVQFVYAIFLTSNLYIFEDYLLVPWNHLEFKKVKALKITPSNKRNTLAISYEGSRVFNMTLNTTDLDLLIDSMKKKNKNIKISKK